MTNQTLSYSENHYYNSQPESICFLPSSSVTVPSLFGQWFLIVLYSVTSLLAFLGNTTVIVVELYGSESAQNIRRYLINLAVSDIIIGVLCVPFTYNDFMLGQWLFPLWLCPTAQYVQLLSVFVTSITLTLIGVERYYAIVRPFSRVHYWLESHTRALLSIIWILGGMYAVIPLETNIRSTIKNNTTTYYCTYSNQSSVLKRRFFITSNVILTFLLPLVVLICSYSAIMRNLIIRDVESQGEIRQQHWASHRRSKTIKMIFTVILLFVICWAPIKLYQFLLDYHILQFCTEAQFYALICTYFVCHWIAMANSFVNPIVYSFMSKSFRKDLQKITKTFHNSVRRNRNQSSLKTISTQV